MNPGEYAQEFRADVKAYQDDTPRNEAKRNGEFGASDFVCRERMRRIRVKARETDEPDGWAAFVGSALDRELKAARLRAHPEFMFDAEWPVTIGDVTFMVHPDEVDPSEPSVTDYKTQNGLAAAEAGFLSDSHRVQRHLQYLGGVQAGVLPAEGVVRNAVVDRSGKNPNVHVEQEPFSMDVVAEAASFLHDVNYAIDNREEASKDWPRPMCRLMCQFYTACRGGEIQDEKITDPYTQALVDAYGQASDMEKQARQLKAELKPMLEDVQGHTDVFRIHWSRANRDDGPRLSLHVVPIKEAS